MNYNVSSRPKLPRNKYGDTDENNGNAGNVYFSSSTTTNNNESSSDITTNINVFVGSTATTDGQKGLVPAPKSNVNEPLNTLNDNVKFLSGSGTWKDIPISRYTTENINKDGIDLNGKLTVSDTINTQTLNVFGAAHFFELIIDKVRAAGGNLLITPATMRIDYVGEDVVYPVDENESPYTEYFYNQADATGIYGLKELFTAANIVSITAKRVYMKANDGENQITSEFVIGDMVRCKTFNIDETGGNYHNKDYWTMVLAVGTDTYDDNYCCYIDLFYSFKVYGNIDYPIGTTINTGGVVVNSPSHIRPVNNGIQQISEEIMLTPSDIDTSNTDEVYIGSSTTIPSGTTLSADIITTDGTKYLKDDVLSADLTLDRGTVIILNKLNSDLSSLPNDAELTTGESNVLVETDVENNDILDDNVGAVLIEEFTFGYGDFTPEVGDNLVSLGHLWDATRETAILISAYDPMDADLRAPAIAQYKGIRTFESLSQYRTTFIASNGNSFNGKFIVNYNGNYMDIDEKLNLFSADINSGLEKVGIHLDGDNSTIKMVGSVEIKQNNDGVIDNLTVWDDDNIMRVKISPEEIPNKSQIQTSINPTTYVNFNSLTGTTLPTSGYVNENHTYSEFIFTWNHHWTYSLENGYYNFTSKVEIGNFTTGDHINISNLNTTIKSKAYFNGQDYVSTRSDYNHSQSISSIILRLKRLNGSSYITVDSFNLTNIATKTVSDESASISYQNDILNNYTIPATGSYIVELEIIYNVFASITYNEEKNPYYFMFDYSVNSNILLVQPSAAMTRIGSNGMIFNTNDAGRYFYAGNDGIEIKWDNSSISLDSTNGFKTTCGITNITSSSSNYIGTDATFINATTLSSATTVYLPVAADYGVGRIITILGNDFVTLSTQSNSELINVPISTEALVGSTPTAKSNCFTSSQTFNMTLSWTQTDVEANGTGTSNVVKNYRSHTPLVRLICNGSGWYLL